LSVIASEAKQSGVTEKFWIASSRSLSSGTLSRDPVSPLRKRFAFVAGNVGINDLTKAHLA
jgi:hypothetical protein